MPKPVMAQVALRLPNDLLDKIDHFAETLRARTPGVRLTRADAARALLTAGLAAEERAATKPAR